MAMLLADPRPARADEEPQILGLITASLGHGMPRSTAFWRWKHAGNPAGRSFVRVVDDDQGLVGLRAMMRWTFRSGDREILAVRPVDTATHPRAQRQGLFSRMTRALLDELADHGVDLVFNTPNAKSGPGYAKLGWRTVGRLTVWVRPGGRFMVGAGRERRPFEAWPGPLPAFEDERLNTRRDPDWLRWRYGEAPSLGYGLAREGDVGIVHRTRERSGRTELTIVDVITPADARSLARCARLLRAVVRGGAESHALAMATRGTREAAVLALAGFVPVPRAGPALMVREVPRRPALPPAWLSPSGWRLQVGDLEVF